MRLTVLGSCASYAGAGRACSGHLVDAGGTAILLDCGNGALSNLARVRDPGSLDAVIVTHAHPDHFADLFCLQALLRYAPGGPAPSMRLFAPPGLLDRMAGALSPRGARDLAEAFDVTDLADGREVVVGGLTVTAVAVDHDGATFGLRVTDDAATLAYTADTAPGARVAGLAEGADVLLAEATLPQEYEGRAPHLTARQAAEVAEAAQVRMLVLTHLWPTTPRESILAEAREAFSGEVVLAEEMLEVAV